MASSGSVQGNDIYNSFVNTGFFIGLQPPPQARSAVCSITYRQNLKVIQRPDITNKLEDALTRDHRQAALWGFGGTGKTQIAIDFAYRRYKRDGEDACAVFWVDATSETTFANDFRSIASKIKISPSLKGKDLYEAVSNRIEEQPSWVMVIDNADDLTIFGKTQTDRAQTTESTQLDLRKFVPKSSNGTVLWTSRDAYISEIVGPAQAIHMGHMKLEEATKLLANNLQPAEGRGSRAKPEDAETAEGQRLVKELGCLPLAISQAGAYIRNTRTDISWYLTALQERDQRQSVLSNDQDDQHRPSSTLNSVYKALDISVRQFQRQSPMAYEMLCVVAFVDRQNIPTSLLSAAVASEGADRLAVTQAVARLQDFSFLEEIKTSNLEDEALYEIHGLSQEAIRHHLRSREYPDKPTIMSLVEGMVNRIRHYFKPGNPGAPLSKRTYGNYERLFAYKTYLILRSLFDVFDINSENMSWDICKVLIAHALVATNNANDCFGLGSGIHGFYVHSGLLGRVLPLLEQLGWWKEQEKAAISVLSHSRVFWGLKATGTLDCMMQLADNYYKQDRLSEAEKLMRECLELRVEVDGNTSLSTLRSRSLLASILTDQDRLNDARELVDDVLVHLRQSPTSPTTEIEIARSTSQLASIYSRLAKIDEGVRLAEDALRKLRRLRGQRHYDTTATMHVLASLYLKQRQYAKAEDLEKTTLDTYRENFGICHENSLRSIFLLGLIYSAQERHDDALNIHIEAFEACRETLGTTHTFTVKFMMRIVNDLRNLERRTEYQQRLLELYGILLATRVETDPNTIIAKEGLASLWQQPERVSEGLKLMQDVLSLEENALGPESQTVKDTRRKMQERLFQVMMRQVLVPRLASVQVSNFDESE